MSTWSVEAWVTAPGEFPARDLKFLTVHAGTIDDAVRLASREFGRLGIDITPVSVRRITPPAGTP